GRKSVMRHIRAIYQTTFDHIPSQKALKSPQKEQDQTFFDGGPVQFLGEQKIEERQDEHNADEPANDPVQPLPKVNVLEVFKVKMVVQFLILRILFVQFKSLFPFLFVHGGNSPLYQFIIGNGES